jgi:hypothetical protein
MHPCLDLSWEEPLVFCYDRGGGFGSPRSRPQIIFIFCLALNNSIFPYLNIKFI